MSTAINLKLTDVMKELCQELNLLFISALVCCEGHGEEYMFAFDGGMFENAKAY